jgi:hypothetical protein
MPLTANIVGVGALLGDDAFLGDIVRWVLGLPIDKKSGVGPNGENCSAPRRKSELHGMAGSSV